MVDKAISVNASNASIKNEADAIKQTFLVLTDESNKLEKELERLRQQTETVFKQQQLMKATLEKLQNKFNFASSDLPEENETIGSPVYEESTMESLIMDDNEFFTSSFWGEDFDDSLEEILEASYEKYEPSNFYPSADTVEKNIKLKPLVQHKQIEDSQEPDKVKDIRLKYVVGKIVGEDLMDKEGKLLASKDSVITEALVEEATREGKLAELIINMQLPETSE